MFLEYQYITI